MGTTTININGIPAAGNGGNTGAGNVGGQTGGTAQNASVNVPTSSDNNRGYSLPSNERMIEDIRREMRQRGVMLVPGSQSMHKIIDEYAQNQRKLANQSIDERYDDLSNNLAEMREGELEKRKKRRLANAYMNYRRLADPNDKNIDADWKYSSIYAQAVKANKEDEERVKRGLNFKDDELLKKAQEERTEVDKELAEAIKTLTSYFEREAESGSNSSYLGRLKEERKQLILERDSATTEEGAIAAQTKLNDVNSRINKILNPDGNKEEGGGFNSLMISQGLSSIFSSLQQGDIAGGVMGAGTSITSMLGLKGASATKALGWIGLAVGAGKGFMDALRQNDDVGELIAVLGGVGSNNYDSISNNLRDWNYNGLHYNQMGLSRQDFAQLAVNYTTSMGVRNGGEYDWFNDAIRLAATEKEYGLSRGQLSKLAKYGRYNGGMANSAYSLGGMVGMFEGFSEKDHSNAQTVLDAYSSVLQSYSTRTNNPKFFDAANTLGTLSSIHTNPNNHFDERTAGEIATFQNLIQNPANDRMQALIYGQVGEMLGTNDLSKIDKYIINPENEVNIMRNVISKISQLYGSPDSEMGYFAFKQLLPNMAPERRENYINAILSGKSLDKEGFKTLGQQNVNYALGTAEKYTSDVTSAVIQIKDDLASILRKIVTFFGE